MSVVLVDTNVWSLAYRRDTDPSNPFATDLRSCLSSGAVTVTGLVYLELLRGFTKASTRAVIEADFAAMPFVEPTRSDYAEAADLSVTCRTAGVQLGTVDALIAQVCIANDLTLLTGDADFTHAARHIPLDVSNLA